MLGIFAILAVVGLVMICIACATLLQAEGKSALFAYAIAFAPFFLMYGFHFATAKSRNEAVELVMVCSFVFFIGILTLYLSRRVLSRTKGAEA